MRSDGRVGGPAGGWTVAGILYNAQWLSDPESPSDKIKSDGHGGVNSLVIISPSL